MGTVVPCLRLGPVFGCALAQHGSLQATGEGSGGSSASQTWWAVGGRFGGTVRWRERLFAGAHLDLLGDLTPARPVFNNVSPWTAFPLEGSLGVDVGVHFP